MGCGANRICCMRSWHESALERKNEGPGGNISSEKIDLLVYGPNKPIVDTSYFPTSSCCILETTATEAIAAGGRGEKFSGAAVNYNPVRGERKTLARFPKARDRVLCRRRLRSYRCQLRARAISSSNTTDVLTGGADIAMGLLMRRARVRQGRQLLRSGLWMTQNFPLRSARTRDRKVGMVGMGRIGQAIGAGSLHRRAGGISFAQSRSEGYPTGIIPTDRDGEGGGYAGWDHPGGSATAKNDQRRCDDGDGRAA